MKVLACGLLMLVALAQAGCKGCSKSEPTSPAGPAPTSPAVPMPEAVSPAAAVSPADAVSPTGLPSYPGPRSESIDHFRITTGFQDKEGQALTQPKALEKNKVYVSVLDPDGHPIGQLQRIERGDMHVFLVARDMRQALYGRADGPVKEGADARAVEFSPREGGDHALITAFQPKGGRVHVVSAPVAIQGALPELMGGGVEGLSNRAKVGSERVQLNTVPTQPLAGHAIQLQAQEFDDKGTTKAEIKLPFVLILNDQMGWGDVVEWDESGKASWLPPAPGTYLVLAPPTHGEAALTWKLTVVPPPK